MAENKMEELIRGNNYFTENVYNNIAPHNENIFFSPLSAHNLITLISQDPGYHNKAGFTNVLNTYNELDQVVEAYKSILALLQSSNNGTTSVVNKAFSRDNYQLQEVFKILLTNQFSYDVQSLDLSKSETAATLINSWVEDKTCKKIKELIDPRGLEEATRLMLLSTINFNDKWAVPFNAEDTTQTTFYVDNSNTVQVQMMRTKREVYYKNDEFLSAKILELPYNNSDASLVVVLPNKGTDIKELEENLRYRNLIDMTESMSKQEVNISLPKFEMEHSIDLKKTLSELGLSTELSENADLFGMIDNDEFLYFDKVQQNGFIGVNEEGTEASTGIICTAVSKNIDDEEGSTKNGLTIYEMDIKSNISNRFAKNLVTCKIKNTEASAKDATFTVTLPDTSFITEFIMEIEGKTYKSYIKEKQEAKNIYKEAVASGKSAGIVESSARDSNEFTVSVNLEPQSVAMFLLTYEEMLQCLHDQYELVLNIRPGQIVENLNIEVAINESRPLKFVKTPSLRSGNEIGKNEKYLNPSTDIKILNTKNAVVKFSPDSKQQRRIARYLGTPVTDGFSGQFVVQYTVERDPQGGEILLQDGYFVHFFAPNDLDPLPKHVVFVLDTSGSMGGRKISQLKDAMMSILAEIRKQDKISIIEFNNEIIVWDINTEQSTTFFYKNYQDPFSSLSEYTLPQPASANDATIIEKAKNVVRRIQASGGTFMIGGLEAALYLVKREQEKCANASEKYQPIIVFLTDGEPNVGVHSTEEIVKIVTRLNFSNNKAPIFSLSFGTGADKQFLRNLSLKNLGFSRHIYEASDASLQLQAFYKQISSPLLSNIKFKYESDVRHVTRTSFPIYFRGSEFVVSGKYQDSAFPTTINCCGPKGPIILKPVLEKPVTSLERLWAYMTVKQLLEERDSIEDKTEVTKKAIELALKYSFVTEVTSLVVVKPNEINAVMTDADVEPTELQDSNLMRCCRRTGGGLSYDAQLLMCASNTNPMLYTRCCVRSRGEIGSSMDLDEELSEEITITKDVAPPLQEEFIADRPFLIYLQFKKENKVIILFKGRFLKPI